jgi:hypothetical protein
VLSDDQNASHALDTQQLATGVARALADELVTAIESTTNG